MFGPSKEALLQQYYFFVAGVVFGVGHWLDDHLFGFSLHVWFFILCADGDVVFESDDFVLQTDFEYFVDLIFLGFGGIADHLFFLLLLLPLPVHLALSGHVASLPLDVETLVRCHAFRYFLLHQL